MVGGKVLGPVVGVVAGAARTVLLLLLMESRAARRRVLEYIIFCCSWVVFLWMVLEFLKDLCVFFFLEGLMGIGLGVENQMWAAVLRGECSFPCRGARA
jgi:hypothetical protein